MIHLIKEIFQIIWNAFGVQEVSIIVQKVDSLATGELKVVSTARNQFFKERVRTLLENFDPRKTALPGDILDNPILEGLRVLHHTKLVRVIPQLPERPLRPVFPLLQILEQRYERPSPPLLEIAEDFLLLEEELGKS